MALITVVILLVLAPATVHADCDAIRKALAGYPVDQCVVSADLTTNGPNTTPADNSRPVLPPNAFTPRTDRDAVAPEGDKRTRIEGQVEGIQVTGAMPDDADARWVLRLPDRWNGKLVMGVSGGLRSEYMGDSIFSDFVIQKGYAYVSTNKGTLNFFFTAPAADPLACRLSPAPAATSTLFTHFYIDEAKDTIGEWFRRTLEGTDLAEIAIEAHYGRAPARVYLFGISNGGHVVRRLLAEAPSRYDGGVDWEGVHWSPGGPNILIDLPVALRLWPGYVESGFRTDSAAYQAMLAAGYPPDMRADAATTVNTFSPVLQSFWETHLNNYWDVTTCVFVRELDPLYAPAQVDPLAGRDTKDYDYLARRKPFHLSPAIGKISTEGDIARPLISLHGTMDALLPMARHGRPFRDAVVQAGRAGLHRYYEVQNGNHIERYSQSLGFSKLERLQPHAHRAFELIVEWVESGTAPPAGQCVPRGGTIVANPADAGRPERCAELLVE